MGRASTIWRHWRGPMSHRGWPSWTSPDLVSWRGAHEKRPCLRRQDVKFQSEPFKDVETKVINHLAPSDIHEWSWMHLILYVRIWLFVDPSGPELPLPIAHWVRRLDSFQWTLVLSHHPDVCFPYLPLDKSSLKKCWAMTVEITRV